MNAAFFETLLTFAGRRALSYLGLSGQVSDNELAKILGAILFLGNEAVQLYKHYKANQAKADRVTCA